MAAALEASERGTTSNPSAGLAGGVAQISLRFLVEPRDYRPRTARPGVGSHDARRRRTRCAHRNALRSAPQPRPLGARLKVQLLVRVGRDGIHGGAAAPATRHDHAHDDADHQPDADTDQ